METEATQAALDDIPPPDTMHCPECRGLCAPGDVYDEDGTCRYCGVPSEALLVFVQQHREVAAARDDDAPRIEFPCELCRVRERLRTLPYCTDCALEQGCPGV